MKSSATRSAPCARTRRIVPDASRAGRAVATMLVLLLAACRPDPGDSTATRQAGAGIPTSPPSITGVVTAVGPGRTLRIEERPGEMSGSEKALARLTDDALLLTRPGATVDFSSITTGARVSAWFIGPVAESYPVQATANVIVVESGNP